MALLRHIVELLNQYANLLLVFITTAYVVLTGVSLYAVRRASFRERAARHLDDIKRDALQPAIESLKAAVATLKGNSLLIQVKTFAKPKPQILLDGETCDYVRKLDLAFDGSEVNLLRLQTIANSVLFSHAQQLHFPKPLREFTLFADDIQRLASDFAILSADCADRIAKSTDLPRNSEHDNLPEFADSDTLVEVCVRDRLLDWPTSRIGMRELAGGGLEVYDAFVHRVLGRGLHEPARNWVEGGVALFREQLAKSDLQKRIGLLVQTADSLQRALQGLELTYDLPGDCQYIGGPKGTRLR